MLAVHPTQLRQGYGRVLMDCVEARAVEDGHMSIRLCYVDMNVYLEKIYSRRGYVQTGTSGCCCRFVCILPSGVRSSAMHDHYKVLWTVLSMINPRLLIRFAPLFLCNAAMQGRIRGQTF